jgi:hypothetical protein
MAGSDEAVSVVLSARTETRDGRTVTIVWGVATDDVVQSLIDPDRDLTQDNLTTLDVGELRGLAPRQRRERIAGVGRLVEVVGEDPQTGEPCRRV